MVKKTSRRKVLAGLSAGAAVSLAGCSDLFSTGPASFDYPEGFSQEGIEDFEKALGKESAHYQADSFSFESSYMFERPDGSSQELTSNSDVSGVNEKQYYYSENENSVQEQYHNGQTIYLRLYSKQQEQTQYRVQQASFNKEGAYLLTLFQNQIQNVDLTAEEVVSENQLRYKATLDSIPDDHFLYQQYNNLTEFELYLTIDTDGFVRSVEVDLTRDVESQTSGDSSGDGSESGTEDGSGEDTTNSITESYSFEFSNHGNVTVEEPDWTSEAEEAQQQTESTTGGTSDGGETTEDGSGDDTTNSIQPSLGL